MRIDEGYIKFTIDWTQGPAPDWTITQRLNTWRRPLYKAGLIGHYADLGIGFGNISVRYGKPGQFVISGSQTGHIADARSEHYSLVTDYDIDGNRVSCTGLVQASSESLTHAAIYELHPSINAVVHVHSRELWGDMQGSLPMTSPDVSYGTPEMAHEFTRLYQDTDFAAVGIAVMAGHEAGIVSIGSTLQQAATRVLHINTGAGS
jgi:ribulose-5-phosphate 4-epimerase/fuculose-1-phosphate aldolase